MALNEESRLLSMRILQNFVRDTKGKWSHDDWAKLMQRVHKAGFGKIDEVRIGKLLEDNRERWLSGDNSVGPPPPGPKPEARKPEPPKPVPHREEKAAARTEEKEKPAMPEQPKKEAPKLEPVVTKQQAPTISHREAKISDGDAQEKHQRRLALIKSSQDLTKESMETEIEIRKQENTQVELQRKLAGLKGQSAPLEQQRERLQQDIDLVTKEISQLQKQIEELTQQRANLEGSVGNRKKERSEHMANLVRLKGEREGLIS